MSAKARVKVGVLGAGRLGRIHVQQWREVASAELIGLYDPHPEKCQALHAEFGVPILPDIEALIAQADIVDIVTPTTTHFACAEAVLRAGRHLFIEKPVTNTLEEADLLAKMIAEKGTSAQVGHVERFNPAFVAALPALKDPMFIETHRLAQFDARGTDVSVVLDLMIHDIDIALSVVKSPVASVTASGVAVVSDTPDIANARIAFANGCVANLTASRISLKKMRKTRFFQRDAYISVDMLERSCEIVRIRPVEGDADPFAMVLDLGPKGRRAISFERPEVPASNAIREELESFATSVLQGTPPRVPLADGQRALEVAHRVLDELHLQHG